MSQLQQALARLNEIEAAVAEGDFEAANNAAQDLKPLLISNNIDELVALRERVNNLTLGVIKRQTQNAAEFKALKQKRCGAEVYQTLSSVR